LLQDGFLFPRAMSSFYLVVIAVVGDKATKPTKPTKPTKLEMKKKDCSESVSLASSSC